MAMPPPFKPLIRPQRSIIFSIVLRNTKNLLHKWNQDAANRLAHTLPFLSDSLSHSPPSLCSRLLLSRPLVAPLLRPPPTTLRSSPLSSMTSPQASRKTVRVVVKGRVQGVFYRNWTVENASQLGLKGWVRNRRNDSVEALFSGSPEAVQEMEQRCRRGPPAAVVTGLEVFPSNEVPGSGFERKPTV